MHLGVQEYASYSDLKALYISGVRGNIFDKWLETKGFLNEELVKRMVDVYRNHFPKISPYPGTKSTLTAFKERFKLGIITDGYLCVQKRKITALNIASFFDAIVYSDLWGKEFWKPNPKPFIEFLKQLDIEPRACLYVGDNPLKDFVAPNKLGMLTARIRRTGGEYEITEPPSEEYKPVFSIESLGDIDQLLNINAQ